MLDVLSVLPGTKTITGTPQYMAPEVRVACILVKYWSNAGQILVKYGQILVNRTDNHLHPQCMVPEASFPSPSPCARAVAK